MQPLPDDFGNSLPERGVLGSISDLLRDLRKLVDLLSPAFAPDDDGIPVPA